MLKFHMFLRQPGPQAWQVTLLVRCVCMLTPTHLDSKQDGLSATTHCPNTTHEGTPNWSHALVPRIALFSILFNTGAD
jgi:hypothetical protein